MIYLECPRCHERITVDDKKYQCSCATIWKEKNGKAISPEIVIKLLRDGETGVLDGFVTQDGKPFSGALIIEDKKVKFKPHKAAEYFVRVSSLKPGSVYVSIDDILKTEINYGLIPVRMAECLGSITAICLLKHRFPAIKKVTLSLNDRDCAEYVLHERTPRSPDIKNAVNMLWNELSQIPEWEVKHYHNKRPKLTASTSSDFPAGIFPDIFIDINESKDLITVRLPHRPDVVQQFKATFIKSRQLGNGNTLFLNFRKRCCWPGYTRSALLKTQILSFLGRIFCFSDDLL